MIYNTGDVAPPIGEREREREREGEREKERKERENKKEGGREKNREISKHIVAMFNSMSISRCGTLDVATARM